VGEQRAHAPTQLLLDQAHHLRGRAVHGGDPVRHLGLLVGGEGRQHLGRLRGRQVGQHQRDDLRVLVLEEGDQLADVDVAQRGEGHLGVDDVEPGEDALGLVLAEAGRQDLAGEVDAAAADEALGGHELVELREHAVDVGGLHRAELHDLAGERLDLPGVSFDSSSPASSLLIWARKTAALRRPGIEGRGGAGGRAGRLVPPAPTSCSTDASVTSHH
jgi:hypothetical protein